jgi:two-component sensor histidine kinase/CheY-like chemotaxis protein
MKGILSGHRILLVEDDAIIAINLCEALENAGGVVVGPARTVERALELIQTGPVDTAVLDIRLEGHNTLELAERLIERGIPVLFQTSDPTLVTDRVRAVPVLRKPIAAEQLIASVQALFDDPAPAVTAEKARTQQPDAYPDRARRVTGDAPLATRIRQQEILAELGVAALSGPPLMKLLNQTARLAAEGLNAEFCKVLEYLPLDNRLLLRAGVGWHSGLVGRATVGAELASPSGYALRTGEPVICNDLSNELRFITPELLAEHGVRRAINVILQGEGSPYGVLEVDSSSQGEFSEHDIAFLQGAANIVGMAIERQRYERRLKEALAHQYVLVREINHRVKNSLQLVASMLNLQAAAERGVEFQLHEASARVAAIDRAHDRLHQTPEMMEIELGQYLQAVCADLAAVVANCEIVFASREELWVATDRGIRIALLLTELVTNAAKHANREGRQGRLGVGLDRQGAFLAILRIHDEGIGLPVGFDLTTSGELGMRLAAALAEQSDAHLEPRRLPSGSEFVITLQLSKSKK